jgi:hypothetical protein
MVTGAGSARDAWMRILVVNKYLRIRAIHGGIVAGIVHGHVCRRRRSVVAR